MESFHHELLNYIIAERKSILKNDQDTFFPRFIISSFTVKNSRNCVRILV